MDLGRRELAMSGVMGRWVFAVLLATVTVLILMLRRLNQIGETLYRIERLSDRRVAPPPADDVATSCAGAAVGPRPPTIEGASAERGGG